MSMSGCMSVCLLVCLKNNSSKLHEMSVRVDYGRGLVFLTTVQYVMYFRFVDDVTFAHNGPGRGDANKAFS